MSSVGSSKDEKSASNSRESSNEIERSSGEAERSEACKRKRTQISLLEYFSKRKKVKEEIETKGMILFLQIHAL